MDTKKKNGRSRKKRQFVLIRRLKKRREKYIKMFSANFVSFLSLNRNKQWIQKCGNEKINRKYLKTNHWQKDIETLEGEYYWLRAVAFSVTMHIENVFVSFFPFLSMLFAWAVKNNKAKQLMMRISTLGKKHTKPQHLHKRLSLPVCVSMDRLGGTHNDGARYASRQDIPLLV